VDHAGHSLQLNKSNLKPFVNTPKLSFFHQNKSHNAQKPHLVAVEVGQKLLMHTLKTLVD
jgi:hypothetical protein